MLPADVPTRAGGKAVLPDWNRSTPASTPLTSRTAPGAATTYPTTDPSPLACGRPMEIAPPSSRDPWVKPPTSLRRAVLPRASKRACSSSQIPRTGLYWAAALPAGDSVTKLKLILPPGASMRPSTISCRPAASDTVAPGSATIAALVPMSSLPTLNTEALNSSAAGRISSGPAVKEFALKDTLVAGRVPARPLSASKLGSAAR